MKFEKLTENQIRIILNTNDLDQNNISIHSFMSNSIQSQDLFNTILDKAEKEIGFITDNYKLIIEAISAPEGNFILTITRINQDLNSDKKKIQAKRKSLKLKDDVFIYKFNNFDDFCEFSHFLKLESPNFLKKLKDSKLFLYNFNYYLLITASSICLEELKILHYMFLEFSEYIHNSKLFESKLNEYGKILIMQNAINTTNKYF